MPLMFSGVAKGTLILASFASCSGNYTDIMQQILPLIPPEEKKFKYIVGNYIFHYTMENKLVYFCITDDNFPSPRVFSFLDDMKVKFLAPYKDLPPARIPFVVVNTMDIGAFGTVIQTEMARYNEYKVSMPQIREELENLKNIMVKNVEKVTLRGERLENLVNRTDMLASTTIVYRSTAVQVQRKYWWKNIRIYVIITVVLAIIAYFCISAACGGLKWPRCV